MTFTEYRLIKLGGIEYLTNDIIMPSSLNVDLRLLAWISLSATPTT